MSFPLGNLLFTVASKKRMYERGRRGGGKKKNYSSNVTVTKVQPTLHITSFPDNTVIECNSPFPAYFICMRTYVRRVRLCILRKQTRVIIGLDVMSVLGQNEIFLFIYVY